MKVLWGVESQRAATTRYRVVVPSRPLLERGWRIDVVDRISIDQASKYDIVCLQRSSTRDALTFIQNLQREGIPVGYDMDDDIFTIEESSPVFALYLNRPDVPWNQLMSMRFSNLLSVSTPRLKDVYSPINPHCRVLENFIDLRDWENLDGIPKWDAISLIWAGSNTHANSLALLEEPLERIVDKYDVRIILVGVDGNPFPSLRWKPLLIGWSAYRTYQRFLKSADIGLAPLAESPFNAAKSDLRIKEYASAGLAIVASDFGEYSASVRACGGFLCRTSEEWFDALATLIEDVALRKAKQEEALEWAKSKDIWNEKNFRSWEEFFVELYGLHGRS